MRITLEIFKNRYETELPGDTYTAEELKEVFSRMLVQATYPPSVIETTDGGHWEYKEGNEE